MVYMWMGYNLGGGGGGGGERELISGSLRYFPLEINLFALIPYSNNRGHSCTVEPR